MTDHRFSRWWDDLKKHQKRMKYWVPHAKALRKEIGASREFRYFTLCSREMIDIFTLVKEGVLPYDRGTRRIPGVRFCEMDDSIFPEIKDMVGVESAGFLGTLDDLVLFADDAYSAKFVDGDDIELELQRLGEAILPQRKKILQNKQRNLELRDSFPYDFLNLDFCDLYYPNPPDTMRINAAIERMVEWQARLVPNGKENLPLKKFLISVTCRFDEKLSPAAFSRMRQVLEKNQRDYPQFRAALRSNKVRVNPKRWQKVDALDFFMAAWPKDLLQIMERQQWQMTILGLAYYDRVSDSGRKYKIASILCECTRALSSSEHEAQSIWLLDKANRDYIPALRKNSEPGKGLYRHLLSVVAIRNDRAKAAARPILH